MHWTAIQDSHDMLRLRFVFETNHNRLSLQKAGLASAHLPHHTAFFAATDFIGVNYADCLKR